MQWSSQQDHALMLCKAWLDKVVGAGIGDKAPLSPDDQVFRLFGFAGTGKTTLARHLAEGLDGLVLYGAFTGKAALVMRQKGMKNASTIHKMVYTLLPFDKVSYKELKVEKLKAEEAGNKALAGQILKEMKDLVKPEFVINEDSPINQAVLLVLDECSMIDDPMEGDLRTFNKPILVLGDPGQLPPINGEGRLTNGDPNIVLTQIHRQALESPVIRWAMAARSGKAIPMGDATGPDGISQHLSEARWSRDKAIRTDQILCGKNITRLDLNRRMRIARGYDESEWPLSGERVICLRNSKVVQKDSLRTGIGEDKSDEDTPPGIKEIFNGMTADVISSVRGNFGVFLKLQADGEDEEDQFLVEAHEAYFQEYKQPGLLKSLTDYDFTGFERFDYAYAITVHKSQGSQWENVTLFDDKFLIWDRDQRKKWLYTAITRAANTITIVDKGK